MPDATNSGNSTGFLSWLTRFLSLPNAAPATTTPRTPPYNGVQEAQRQSDENVAHMAAIGQQAAANNAQQAAVRPSPIPLDPPNYLSADDTPVSLDNPFKLVQRVFAKARGVWRPPAPIAVPSGASFEPSSPLVNAIKNQGGSRYGTGYAPSDPNGLG